MATGSPCAPTAGCARRSPAATGHRTHRVVNLPFEELLDTCQVCSRTTCSGIYVRRDAEPEVKPVALTADGLALNIWTVYDHPTDWPDYFVARRFEMDQPTENMILARLLPELRQTLAGYGLVRMERKPADDPTILETWI